MEVTREVQTKQETAQPRKAKATTKENGLQEKRKHQLDGRTAPETCKGIDEHCKTIMNLNKVQLT